MNIPEPERVPPHPAHMGVEVASLALEIQRRNPNAPYAQIRTYARQVVVLGRTIVEQIRAYGRIIR